MRRQIVEETLLQFLVPADIDVQRHGV